ncbi:MAG: cyclic nucleotide-binding domain-containing protein [Acidobacteria bacterium]|nr:cyclic nucleotide-binding domain-containing protein [Acidobacteriota bacterium]
MPTEKLVDRLTGHKTLGGAPREELTWLASRGMLRQMHPGQVLTAKGTRPKGLFVVLSGSFSMSVDRGGGPRKIMEWREGDVMGMLPYSRVAGPPGDSVAQEPAEILELQADQIRELTETCHEITATLVHAMIDRAKAFTSSDLHDEKMLSLGKLSAGLAHELNNPAAAIERSAVLLDERLEANERAARALGALQLSDTQLAAVDAAREACLARQESGVRSPIEQAEREEAMSDWLADRGLDITMAELLADTAVTFEALDKLAQAIDRPALNAVLRWGASGCSVRSLASEIQDAAMRISGLVTAIKGFTHMDQAAIAAPVDLAQGLSNTVTVLRAKARARSATVVVETEPGLPRARGFAGELNQIWANLIDNALDAIPDAGRVEVTANREGRQVVVCVIDNGPGISAQIRERIFDPFFTTKPMGEGTGLGLDIVRRLVRHNDGEISVESQPGRTRFRVALAVAEMEASGGTH